ncbi:MAG: chitin-binding domain-containing protein [Candidatus Thiodiazotropha sp.]
MPDGPNPYPNRILTEYYLICSNNQTVGTEICTRGEVFDPILATCTKEVDKCK